MTNFNSGIMMMLGQYRFCIDSAAYQTFTRSTEYHWEELKRIGKDAAMQFVDNGTDTITLEGTIYPHFRGGVSQVDSMRLQAAQGEPLMLVSGNGAAFGRWCIVSISETQTTFMSNGSPRKVTFNLKLKRYGEDNRKGGAR